MKRLLAVAVLAAVLFGAVLAVAVAADQTWSARAWRYVISPAGFTTILTGATVVLVLSVVVLTIAGRLRRRLHFQAFNGADEAPDSSGRSAVLRALIRAELHRLAEESARLPGERPLRLDQAGPYEDEYGSLDTISDGLGPQWKALSAATSMLISLLPSQARLVTGFLLGTPTLIAGIETIDGRRQATAMIRCADHGFPPDPPDDLAQLAVPAAAWVLLSCYQDAVLGGTGNWASYVAWAAGYAWEAKGDLGKAKERYQAACADRDNLAASVNLAALEQLDERASAASATSPASAASADPARQPSYQRLSRIIAPGSGVTSDNLQWYRAHDLLSRDIRDRIDDQSARSVAAGTVAGDQPSGLAARARELAIDLAIAMEARAAAGGGGMPAEFFAKRRAAALTLVARQVIPQATNLSQVFTPAPPGSDLQVRDLSDGDIRGLLDRLKRTTENGDSPEGASERLVGYVKAYCQLDDEAVYNLARYHEQRAVICDTAIARWGEQLREADSAEPSAPVRRWREEAGDGARAWRGEVERWQDGLRESYRAELRNVQRYREELQRRQETLTEGDEAEGDDPPLTVLVKSMPRLPGQMAEEAPRQAADGGDRRPPAPASVPESKPWDSRLPRPTQPLADLAE